MYRIIVNMFNMVEAGGLAVAHDVVRRIGTSTLVTPGRSESA